MSCCLRENTNRIRLTLQSRGCGSQKRGEFSGEAKLARLLFEYQCQNTNFGRETGLRKATKKKNCNRHVAFLIHTVLSSRVGNGCVSYTTSLLRSSPQFREEFHSTSLNRRRLFILRSELRKQNLEFQIFYVTKSQNAPICHHVLQGEVKKTTQTKRKF